MVDDVIDDLREIGLTEYQSRAYLAATELGQARFSDIAEEADIPQQRIYDVIDDIRDLGFVEVHEGSGGKEAVAVPPETVLEEHKERHISEFSSRVDSLSDALGERYQKVDTSLGFVTVVNHPSSVNRHIERAIEAAEWWLFASTPAEAYADVADAIGDAVDRGVSVRLLVHDAPGRDDEYPAGATVRTRESADTIVAADRAYGVFRGISSPAVTRPALVTKDENITEMLQRYSEQIWAASRTVQDGDGLPHWYLAPWQLIDDIDGAVPDGDTYRVTVVGHDTDTGRAVDIEGRLVDVTIEAGIESDFSVVLPEVARLTVATEDGWTTVGGWDATLEDVAAHAVRLEHSS